MQLEERSRSSTQGELVKEKCWKGAWSHRFVRQVARSHHKDHRHQKQQLLTCPKYKQNPLLCGCCSVAESCSTLCDPKDSSTPGLPVLRYLQSLLRFMSMKLVTLSNHLTLCLPLLLLPSIFPSIRVFSSELTLHIRWPKWPSSASASVLPVNIQGWFPLGLICLLRVS